MLKRISTLMLLAIFIVSTAFVQKNGSIRGVITDNETGDKFPFATVTLKKNGELLPIGTVTGNDGAFKLNGLQHGAKSGSKRTPILFYCGQAFCFIADTCSVL